MMCSNEEATLQAREQLTVQTELRNEPVVVQLDRRMRGASSVVKRSTLVSCQLCEPGFLHLRSGLLWILNE